MKAIDIKKEEKEMNTHRTVARIAGVLLIIGTVTALVSIGLTGSTLGAPDYLTSMMASSKIA